MEGSKRTTIRFGHLCSSTEKGKRQKKKKVQPYDRKLLVKHASNRFKFIVTPTHVQNLLPPSQKWNYD